VPKLSRAVAVGMIAVLLTSCLSSNSDEQPADNNAGESCLSGTNAESNGDYAGLTEDEAADQARAEGLRFRVIARDGVCLGGDSDQDPLRLNVHLQDGQVVWSGRG